MTPLSPSPLSWLPSVAQLTGLHPEAGPLLSRGPWWPTQASLRSPECLKIRLPLWGTHPPPQAPCRSPWGMAGWRCGRTQNDQGVACSSTRCPTTWRPPPGSLGELLAHGTATPSCYSALPHGSCAFLDPLPSGGWSVPQGQGNVHSVQSLPGLLNEQ